MSDIDGIFSLLADGCLSYGQMIVSYYSASIGYLLHDPMACAFIGYYATLWNKVSILTNICYNRKVIFPEVGERTFKKAIISDPAWLDSELSRRTKSSAR